MNPPALPGSPRRPEQEIVRAVARYFGAAGYHVYRDPDGRDYFDLVVRRGREVGLVEAKVRDGREVLAQALRRRGWGDWVAVALGSPRAAERLSARTAGTRAAGVGVLSAVDGVIRVHRLATAARTPGPDDPFGPVREEFRHWLDQVDALGPASGVRWDGVLGAVRRASGGRGFAEWRLDEPRGAEG